MAEPPKQKRANQKGKMKAKVKKAPKADGIKKAKTKRPPSKYNVFVKEYFRVHRGSADAKVLMAQAGQEWKRFKEYEAKGKP
jgi:hypothetical protein